MFSSRIGAVLALAIVVAASASAQCYQFSGSGVTLKVNITGINLQFGPTTVSGLTQTDYVTSGTNSLTLGGTTLTSISASNGAVDIVHLPSIGGSSDVTGFTVSVPNGDAPGKGSHSWVAYIAGNGDLIPGQLLPQRLLPISAWVGVGNSDYIEVSSGSTVNKYPITAVVGCSTSGLGKGLGTVGDIPGACECGDPINIANGNLFEEVIDYRTAGRNRLAFTRYYNSLASPDTVATALGLNWRSNYDRYLRLDSESAVTAERADGQEVSFALVGNLWTTDSDIDLKLTNAGATWTLTDRDDTVEMYTPSGSGRALLQSIVARGGYTQTLQYDASNQLASVTDSYNRKLTFLFLVERLLSITTPDGSTLAYGYNAANRLTSVTYSTSPATSQTYVYENPAFSSALTGIVDENGNRFATWAYDSSGRAISSQHAGGADLTTVAYHDSDGSRTVTNALGAQTVYKFTTLQNAPKVTEADRLPTSATSAAVMTFTYDSNGYPASLKDWNGNTTSRVNNVHGQPVTVTEAVGTPQERAKVITYHAAFHLPIHVVEPGLTTDLTYDANGNALSMARIDTTTNTVPYSTNGSSRTWTYTWANSLPASVMGPRTDATQLVKFHYDETGALTSVTNALNQVHSVTQHLPGGLPLAVIDPNGVTTNYTYDRRFRLLSSTMNTAAGALSTKYSYDAVGDLIGLTAPDASALEFTVDSAHRLIGIKNALMDRISYALDAFGNWTGFSISNSTGVATRQEADSFDALGRLMQRTGGTGQISKFRYDSNGNRVGLTDPLQHVTQWIMDPLNRATKVIDAANGTTGTTYDAHDRLSSITDPNGGVTTYVYDGFGDLIQENSPSRGSIVYRYDAAGNLAQRTDARGSVTNYAYDALNRLLTITFPGDPAENVSETYDEDGHGFGIGRQTSVTDAVGALSRSYDERGNVVSESRIRGTATLSTVYAYDAASRIASITYPSRALVSYARDGIGRISSTSVRPAGAAQALSIASSVAYQPFGTTNAFTFGNGITETLSFDLDGKVTGISDGGVQKLNYSYDAASNVLSIADGVAPDNAQTFRYDSLNRLTGAAGAYGNFGYGYDANGNRLTETRTAGDPAALDGLSSITDLSYNEAGRLASTSSSGQQLAQYGYEASGRRVVKLSAATGLSLFQYGTDGMLLEEADAQGAAKVDYVYLNGRPIATVTADGKVYFLHDDRLGSPQRATDASQKTVWIGDYQPFGALNATSSQTSSISQDLRLPGQQFDVETGIHQNGFRDYAPGLGRYLESDPIGLFGGMNPYEYTSGNPLRYTDPSGLCEIWDWLKEQLNDKAEDKLKELANYDEYLKQAAGVQDGSATADALALRSKLLGPAASGVIWWTLGHALGDQIWVPLLSDPDWFPRYTEEQRDLIDLYYMNKDKIDASLGLNQPDTQAVPPPSPTMPPPVPPATPLTEQDIINLKTDYTN